MDAPRTSQYRRRVAEVMTADPVTLAEDEPVEAAGLKLLRHGISGAPVVTADGLLVGVFSDSDLLPRIAAPRIRTGSLARAEDRQRLARTVGQACSRPAAFVNPDTTLDTAARELLDRDIARLVVVEEDRVVGILTRRDLLRVLAPAPEVVAAAIADALRADLIETVAATITADGGLRLHGSVRSRGELELVKEAAALAEAADVPVVLHVDVAPHERPISRIAPE